jgi:hypothetical protein
VGDPETSDICFNGINGSSGDYLLPPLTADQLFQVAKGEKLDPTDVDVARKRAAAAEATFLGVKQGVDPTKLAESGWGIVFAHGVDPAIRDALKPLVEHRREQASAVNGQRFKEYVDADAIRPGETSQAFRSRHGVGLGDPADPDKMPYYLLLVGDPETIPYRVQYQLDVTFAVGRIDFDTPEEYAQYAQAVVNAEIGGSRPTTATLFGVRNHNDPATTLSADHLVSSLATSLPARLPKWSFSSFVGDGDAQVPTAPKPDGAATKANLTSMIGGPQTPTLLFSASHGIGFDNGDPRQLAHQGAPLCQDWPGPLQWQKTIPPDFYFSADDIGDDADVAGLVAFFFACYGAGTPKNDDFAAQLPQLPPEIAPHAFVGRLPQRLLGHPKGGALAVVGHIERAWGYSFMWPKIGEQIETFVSTLATVMGGAPIGSAVEFFNDKYATLTTELEDEKENLLYNATPNPMGISGLWTARNDARNYVILGDPAVRLNTGP